MTPTHPQDPKKSSNVVLIVVLVLGVIEHGDPREYGPDAVDDRDHQAVVAARWHCRGVEQ